MKQLIVFNLFNHHWMYSEKLKYIFNPQVTNSCILITRSNVG